MRIPPFGVVTAELIQAVGVDTGAIDLFCEYVRIGIIVKCLL